MRLLVGPLLASIYLVIFQLSLFINLGSASSVKDYAAELQRSRSCCDVISLHLPGKTFWPSDEEYEQSRNSYFLLNERLLAPNCIVYPSNSEDVSTAVKILSAGHSLGMDGCKFAIKSGGHSAFSNIEDGVTIDVSKLDQITVSDDRSAVSVGPGLRLGVLYATLEQMNLTVVAGRDSDVGVGGLLLGGGISFFSPRFGFACDNILNYEVVLASGETVNASESSNPDLYRALKGGSNNFGIVTRFDMHTISSGEIWGGVTISDISRRETIFNFLVEFNNAEDYDPNSALILFPVWHHQMGWFIQSTLSYTERIENPPVFQKLTALPSLHKSTRIRTIKDITDEIAQSLPPGQRCAQATFTFKNNLAFMEVLHELTNKSVSAVSDRVKGLLFGTMYQPQPRTILKKTTAHGSSGNSLGLDDSEDDLVNAFALALWQEADDDETMSMAVRELIEEAVDEAKKMGVWHRFVYMNYAGDWQDVIGGYGEGNVKAMIEVSKKFDPDQLFQLAVPGGFKLGYAQSARVRDEL